MSKTEKTEISDLRRYMEKSLAEHYTQVITFKDREDSFVSLYAHKDSGQKVLLRRSGNRNDGVYRALRGKQLCNLPMVLEVCSEEVHLLVLEEYRRAHPGQNSGQRPTDFGAGSSLYH